MCMTDEENFLELEYCYVFAERKRGIGGLS